MGTCYICDIKMKTFELQNSADPLEEADLTIIKQSLFSSLKEIENWISLADLTKSGVIILISDTSYGGDMTKISEYINGTSSHIEDAVMLFDIVKGNPIQEDPPYYDEYSVFGVSTEEFEETLKQAALPWDHPDKRDDGTTC